MKDRLTVKKKKKHFYLVSIFSSIRFNHFDKGVKQLSYP